MKKQEKKYKVIALENFGVYRKGELIKIIKTIDLEGEKEYSYRNGNFNKVTYKEIK